VILLVLWFSWATIKRAIIAHDLREYATEIRQSDLDVDAKIRLLNQIDDLENELDGDSIGLLRWRSTDAAVKELLRGEITSDDTRLIERELRQVQDRLK